MECTSRRHIFSKLLISVFEVIIVAVGLSMITSNSIITYTHFFLQKMLILAFELKRVYLSCQISVFFPVLVHSAWAWNTAAKICSSLRWISSVEKCAFICKWQVFCSQMALLLICEKNILYHHFVHCKLWFFAQKNAAVVISYEVYLDFLITKYIPD